jgi:hypothetical protein
MRRSLLVAMGLVACQTRALGPVSSTGEDDDVGEESSGEEEGSSGEGTTGTSVSTTEVTTDPTGVTTATSTTSMSTSATSSGETGEPLCEENPDVWDEVRICRPLVGSECTFCDDDPECRSAAEQMSGGCSPSFQYTVCGPELVGGECCSVVYIEDWGCEGRPFVVDGESRVADPVRRDDWRAGVQPALDGLDEELRARLGASWRQVALAEHASIASFARFVLDLLAVGAPADLVLAAQRATADEIVHARLAFGLASHYLGEATGPGPLRVDGSIDDSRDLASIVRAVIVEGCIGETVSAARAELELEGCSDPAVRRVLTAIARDERRHAQLAWQFVGWALRHDPSLRDVVDDTFTARLVGIELDPVVAPVDDARAAILRGHGVLTTAELAALTHTVALDVIAPCFAALLDAPQPAAA